MTFPLLLLASVLLLATATSLGETAAQSARATFASSQVFEDVTTTTAFACNKRDSSGRSFGTAHEMTTRTTYDFRPNGLVRVHSDRFHGKTNASYSIAGRVVTLRFFDDKGRQVSVRKLTLSKDGMKLGNLKKLVPKP